MSKEILSRIQEYLSNNMNKKIKATAKVQITLEFALYQPWGGECQISQLYEQANREARELAVKAIANGMPSARLVGDPKVMGIITETDS